MHTFKSEGNSTSDQSKSPMGQPLKSSGEFSDTEID